MGREFVEGWRSFFMLTVADTLQLDALKGAQIVAGSQGLDHAVSWVHVVGVPDAARWLNGGELILTTYINLPQDVDGQRDYMQALADKGVAAMALAVGSRIDHAPPHLIEVADRNDFPLIEIPYDLRFIDVARTVNEHIAQENMAKVSRALSIHRVLTQLVLDGGDLKQLAETLANLIGQSISKAAPTQDWSKPWKSAASWGRYGKRCGPCLSRRRRMSAWRWSASSRRLWCRGRFTAMSGLSPMTAR
jgi:hypothetical protein